jgi:hypothetical protein
MNRLGNRQFDPAPSAREALKLKASPSGKLKALKVK